MNEELKYIPDEIGETGGYISVGRESGNGGSEIIKATDSETGESFDRVVLDFNETGDLTGIELMEPEPSLLNMLREANPQITSLEYRFVIGEITSEEYLASVHHREGK